MRADARQKHERILESARVLFRANGFDAVTMDEVAKAAEVGPGTLYRHFPNKETLYEAIHVRWIQRLNDAVDQARELDGTAAERLRAWLGAYVAMLTASKGYASRITRSFGRPESPFAAKCAAYLAATQSVLEELGPSLRRDVAALEICRLVGGVASGIDECNFPAESVDDLLAIVCDGLLAR